MRCTRSRGSRGFFCLQVDRRAPVIVDVITLNHFCIYAISEMNPYETPHNSGKSLAHPRRLDVGVLILAAVMLTGCVVSFLAFAFDPLHDFLMPRFGTLGLIEGMNCLIFVGFWIKNPTRLMLFCASFVTCFTGVLNGLMLMHSGIVDVVENFHDRVHSAWLWAVIPYLIAGGYFAFVASRQTPVGPNA